jgi:hypothetical protein
MLRRHLEPENSRRLLSLAGLYLVAYELVRTTVLHGVQGFFTHEWDAQRGFIVSEAYGTDVMAGQRYELEGCLAWLVKMSALTEEEAAVVGRLRSERNKIAHQIAAVIGDPTFEFDLQPLLDAHRVLKRVAVFFGGITVDTDPEFDSQEVDYEDIESGASLLYSHALQAFAASLAES